MIHKQRKTTGTKRQAHIKRLARQKPDSERNRDIWGEQQRRAWRHPLRQCLSKQDRGYTEKERESKRE